MFEHRYQTLVGAAGLGLFAAALVWIFFFDHIHLSPGIRVHVEFSRLSILETGAPVKIGAQKVGVVEKIQFLSHSGRARVTLWIQKDFSSYIFSNSRVYLESLSLIGERHVNIVLPEASQELGHRVKDGEVLQGEDPAHMDNLLTLLHESLNTNLRFWKEMSPEFRKVSSRMEGIESHRPWLRDTVWPRIRSIAQKIRDFPELGAWVDAGSELPDTRMLRELVVLLDRLEEASSRFGRFSEELDRDLAVWRNTPIPGRVSTMKKRLERIGDELDALQGDVRILTDAFTGSRGTLQSFLSDPSIYNDLRQMARRLKNAPLDMLFKRRERRVVPK